MKINEVVSNPSAMSELASKEDRKVSDSKEANFQNQLKRVENQNFEDRIQDLVSRITEQGERLGKRTDIRELKAYKNLVSEFLDEAVGNSHKFSKESFLDRRGRHRVYANIKKINEQLGLLTEDVLSKEKDNIKILQRMDDIRGLILDLTL